MLQHPTVHLVPSDIAKCSLKYQLRCQKHKTPCHINREECARRRNEEKKNKCGEAEMTGPVFHVRALVPLQFVNTLCLVNVSPDTRFNVQNYVLNMHSVCACFVWIPEQTAIVSLYGINTLRTGLLNCLNARSRGLNFRHRASSI